MATNSIVDYLSSKGQDSSYANRAKLAQAQGIQNYTGTAGQNTKLLELLSKPAPATVSSSSLQPNNQIAIPQNNVSQIPALPVVSQQQADVNNATTQNTQAEQGYNQANSDLQTLSNQLANKGTDTLALEQQQGIPQISQNVLDLQDLANQKALEANLTPYSLQGQGRGIPTQILRGQEALKQRQLQVEGIFANAQLQAAQGKLQLAQSQVDRAINLKYEPILAKIDAQKQILENNKYLLSRSDQKLATAKQNLLEQQKIEQQQKMQEEKDIREIGLKLGQFGVNPSIIKDVLSSKSINDAMMRAGNNLQDPKAKLELLNLKAEIALRQAQARKADREAILTTEPTEKQKKATALAVTQAEASRQAAQDKIEAVDSILSLGTGISARVGPSVLSRGIVGPALTGAATGAGVASVVPGVGTLLGGAVGGALGASKGITSAFTGQGQQVSGAVHQLTAGLTLKELTDAKANGATFGALSDGERSMLASAATKLNDWEVKDDKGNPTGYWNIDEASFRKELKTIQDLNKKALLKSQGTLIAPDEKSQLDSLFQPEEPTANQYYQ